MLSYTSFVFFIISFKKRSARAGLSQKKWSWIGHKNSFCSETLFCFTDFKSEISADCRQRISWNLVQSLQEVCDEALKAPGYQSKKIMFINWSHQWSNNKTEPGTRHFLTLRQRQRKNIIEISGQEKIRKMIPVMSLCLNGETTTTFVILQ